MSILSTQQSSRKPSSSRQIRQETARSSQGHAPSSLNVEGSQPSPRSATITTNLEADFRHSDHAHAHAHASSEHRPMFSQQDIMHAGSWGSAPASGDIPSVDDDPYLSSKH